MLRRPSTATRKRQPINMNTIIMGDHPGREGNSHESARRGWKGKGACIGSLCLSVVIDTASSLILSLHFTKFRGLLSGLIEGYIALHEWFARRATNWFTKNVCFQVTRKSRPKVFEVCASARVSVVRCKCTSVRNEEIYSFFCTYH